MSTANPMKSYRRYKGGRARRAAGKVLRTVLVLVLLAILAFGVLAGIVMAGERDEINGDCRMMIVLGCRVMPSGQPSVLLRDRLDEALDWLEDHPDTIVVVSGGAGANEPISEARCMADYLVNCGYPQEQILLEEGSFNTNENLRFSIRLLADQGCDVTDNIMVVSNGFHLARVRMLWNRIVGGKYNLSTLAAPASHEATRFKMYVREPFALAKSCLLDWGV